MYKGSKCFLTTSPIHPITHTFMLLFLSVPTLWLADWRNQRSTHHTGTWNHVSIIYGIASTTFSSAHSALFSVSCFFSTFLLYPSLFASYQPLSVSQQSPGLELFLNMSEWIEGQWVCKRTHRHTHCATQWCLGIPGMSVSQLETAVCEGWMNEKRTDTLWEDQELIRDEERERERQRNQVMQTGYFLK